MPAELRKELLLIGVQAKQREVSRQFINQLVEPVVRKYSPFDPDEYNITLEWDEPLEDKSDRIEDVDKISDYLTTNEIREEAGYAPVDGAEGDEFSPPGKEQEEESEDGFGGLFQRDGSSDRKLETYDDYPEAAQENARMALEAREGTGNPNDCGTQVGWERANQLDNGEALSKDTISRMAAFERHEDNKEQGEEGRADCGWLMWKAWGGDEGIEWAQRKLDELEDRENASGDSGNVSLADGDVSLEEFEATMDTLQHDFVHAEDTSKSLTEFTESQLPQMVKDRLRQAIMSGALFSEFDTIPSSELMELRSYFADTLTEDGWSLDEMAEEISDTFGVTLDNAETIARTETQSVAQFAAEDAYREFEQERGEEFRFKWVGSTDDRTTEACLWLLEQTNPNYGGTPVPLDELKELIQEAPEHDPDLDDNMARTFTPHVNCRKRYIRHVE